MSRYVPQRPAQSTLATPVIVAHLNSTTQRQVVGEVLSGNTMRANRHHTLGQEFDLDVYGQFCKISTGSMRHLFVRD